MAKISRASLFTTIVLAPLPFGSVENQWIAVWCVLLALSLGLVTTSTVSRRHFWMLVPVFAIVALFGLTLILQSIAIPLVADPIWAEASRLLGKDLPEIASASIGASWISLGSSLAFIMTFLCTYFVCTEASRANTLLHLIGCAGLAYAIWGMGELVFDPENLLWDKRTAYIGDLTGTFVNRNTAATYFGSCSIVWLCLLLSELKKDLRRDGTGALLDWRVYRPSNAVSLRLAALLICLLAVFLTKSRAGTIITVAVLVVTSGIFLLRTFPTGAKSVLGLAGLLIAAGILVELWGGLVALRISSQGLFDESRWLAYKGTLAMIADHPWLGSGLGTFEEVFPAYRPEELASNLTWDLAHNSLLELTSDLGLPFAAAFVVLWFYIVAVLLRGCLSRRRGAKFPVAAIGVGLLGSIHSLVDFSLQIPGYAIVFAAVVACGFAQATRAEEPLRSARSGRSGPTARTVRKLSVAPSRQIGSLSMSDANLESDKPNERCRDSSKPLFSHGAVPVGP